MHLSIQFFEQSFVILGSEKLHLECKMKNILSKILIASVMLFSFPTVALAAHSWETVRMERLGEG